jgi:N-acetylglucosamine kinase-like BadF-type ATPase
LPNTPTYIGFDGGGTTSRFLIKRGEHAPENFSYSLNLKYTDLGVEQSAKSFSQCLKKILDSDFSSLHAMCISLSGASNESENKKFAAALRKELSLPEIKLHIESDSSLTLHTAYPDKHSGLLLIAGTGSVAMAKKRNGEIIKIGGLGRLLGDEGSGYWIGLQALKYYCNVLQETEDEGKLFGRIKEKLHFEKESHYTALRHALYANEIKPQDFAPIVFDSLRDDCYAKNILYDAARHLIEGVEILWEKVRNKCEPVLILHGKVGLQEFIVRNIIEDTECLGIECTLLEERVILDQALDIARKL